MLIRYLSDVWLGVDLRTDYRKSALHDYILLNSLGSIVNYNGEEKTLNRYSYELRKSWGN